MQDAYYAKSKILLSDAFWECNLNSNMDNIPHKGSLLLYQKQNKNRAQYLPSKSSDIDIGSKLNLNLLRLKKNYTI